MSRVLIIVGLASVAAGLLWPWFARLGLGRLPRKHLGPTRQFHAIRADYNAKTSGICSSVGAIRRLGDEHCSVGLCPSISGKADAGKAEQHHRPGGNLGTEREILLIPSLKTDV